MPRFEWDPEKSRSNKIKHGINFKQAKEVFKDNHAIVDKAKNVKGEPRFLAIGKTLKLFLITVVFTLRDASIRIISARQARKKEIKAYLINSLNDSNNDKTDEDDRTD